MESQVHRCSSPRHLPDLFGASYGSFDFYNQPGSGLICLFSLKNPSHPEYTCLAPCGVLCLDISTAYPHMVVAGLYDGNVAVYNLCSEGEGSTIAKPSHISSASNGKHSEPVWQVGPLWQVGPK